MVSNAQYLLSSRVWHLPQFTQALRSSPVVWASASCPLHRAHGHDHDHGVLRLLFYLVEMFIDGREGGKAGVLVVGGEIVRHICGYLVAGVWWAVALLLRVLASITVSTATVRFATSAFTFLSMYLLVAFTLAELRYPATLARPWTRFFRRQTLASHLLQQAQPAIIRSGPVRTLQPHTKNIH